MDTIEIADETVELLEVHTIETIEVTVDESGMLAYALQEITLLKSQVAELSEQVGHPPASL